MKIYKTQEEVEKDIKDEVLAINDDVTFECSISINASINARNINARNIDASNINAWNINAGDIKAVNINARDIDAWDINASINAGDIEAGDINAGDIEAGDISYYAFCSVYNSIKCLSIKGRRKNHQEPVCLDGELIIEKQKEIDLSGKEVEVKVDGKVYKAVIKN